MELKLAEYNLETGKFERFLELGKDFLFGGDYIEIIFQEVYKDSFGCLQQGKKEYTDWQKDQKDPLNRFGGLFDGRTYGNGKFVLIKGKTFQGKTVWEDDYISYPFALSKADFEEQSCGCCSTIIGVNENTFDYEVYSNLHENPELWKKIK